MGGRPEKTATGGIGVLGLKNGGESEIIYTSLIQRLNSWIPAFAGMTFV
jgi:hypothetical protein